MKCNLIECSNEIHITTTRLKRTKSGLIFCSKECKNIALQQAMKGNDLYVNLIPAHYQQKNKCQYCNEHWVTNPYRFCSNKCANEYKKQERISEWLKDPQKGTTSCGAAVWVRNEMLRRANYACSKCGWNEINPTTNKTPLELDHIDGNHMNNDINNLRILCPNCHSLTPNYKALNKNKTEQSRYQYFKEKNWW